MNALLLAGGVFVILGVSTAAGMAARDRLPSHHLNTESKEVIRLATAIVGTLAALALGLLIASANSDYKDAQTELDATAARIVLLDRLMAQYGPETTDARDILRQVIENRLERGWTIETSDDQSAGRASAYKQIETVQGKLRALEPQDQVHRLIQSRALEVSGNVAEGHWLQIESADEGLPWGFFIVLVYWLALLFGTFGLQAPANPTVLAIIIVCALSVAGAVFAISDMANPYAGFIQVSDQPLQGALSRLGGA
ncbi:DUF4239 domain-containing protein (plasmid) [Rhizobium grahamii]|uniref:DUF4239 domain-containing protein n=1 Tax=Rhizobium grahamii TaxID=1120045 RepID=A0A5Q0CDE3_9HYPH|nr:MULTISPECIES: DUF4239 domain-containing protein [Rhizobium]QFY63393.1 DUF4239 domain-containing protein [Rhizobium grahamii]QRM51842.1 DUF4239 domain-containing protein [Rhizobium sp. BG6]